MNEEQKLRRDVAWNFGAFMVLGVSGIALNVAIARLFDSTALGVFNQVLTFYILIPQLAVFGVHFSVLKLVSEHGESENMRREIVTAGLIVVLPITAVTVLVTYLVAESLGRLLYSDEVIAGLIVVLPGIALFSLNKLFINVLNGMRMMRAFALAQVSRPLMFLAGTVLLGAFGFPPSMLPWVITCSETILFCALALVVTARLAPPKWSRELIGRCLEHLRFGWKAFLGGGLSEANSRVDILVAGALLTDREVGIYSIASMIIEGLVQLPTVLRNNLNPIITRLIAAGRIAELRAICMRAARVSYAVMASVGVLLIVLFPLGIRIAVGNPEYDASWPVFIAACTGVIIAAGAFPIEMFMLQAGYPGLHTVYKGIVLALNVALSVILISLLGLIGVGVASGLTFVLSAFLLLIFVKAVLGRLSGAR
jgi:O-antigen/teichoic acid export membrane protein